MKRAQPIALSERRRQFGELLRGLSQRELDELLVSAQADIEVERRRADYLQALEAARRLAESSGDSNQQAHVEAEISAWSAFSTAQARTALGID